MTRDVVLFLPLVGFVECVQYVDLLPSAANVAATTTAFQQCRRSGPFNNPLSHFCVSEEGREGKGRLRGGLSLSPSEERWESGEIPLFENGGAAGAMP